MPKRGGFLMDARTLGEAMGWSLTESRYEQLLPHYERMLREIGVRTPRQAAMVAAQLGHESVGLKYSAEIWGPTPAQRTYDGRMGNRPGTDDWSRYRGHGWVQITGRDNHTACSRWAHSRGLVPDPDFFVRHPDRLGWDEYVWIGPSWYWTQARPQLNALSDAGDLEGATRAINGGTNGIEDRRARYQRCLALGGALLPGGGKPVIEKRLDYPRDEVHQDTGWNCGPASAQTVIRAAAKKFIPESVLAAEMGTHRGGTDHIGQITRTLQKHIPAAKYATVEMPNDPPSTAQRERLWQHLTGSIDAGFGLVVNIVAPPNNYPRPSHTSTTALAYSGGTVYHYVAAMGYATDGNGVKHVWLADSGFKPYGSWITFAQFATLIPPKGYAYATTKAPAPQPPAPPVPAPTEEVTMPDHVQSLINPDVRLPLPHYRELQDAYAWRTEVLLRGLYAALGLDADRVLADALAADHARTIDAA